MSQVLLVKPIGDPVNALNLPPKFILKVYDPRIYPYRLKKGKQTMVVHRGAKRRPATGRNPEFDECSTPKGGDAVSWEEFFFF
jgi:hypothetical protein